VRNRRREKVPKCDLIETAARSFKRPVCSAHRQRATRKRFTSLGEAAQKFEYRSADLCRALLLGKVPAAREHLNVA
jgi:hypothetical protein